MRLETYRLWLRIMQGVSLVGLGLAIAWNVVGLWSGWQSPAWGVEFWLPLCGVVEGVELGPKRGLIAK